jgi:two-component system, NtrC family, sensor kinase
MRGTSSRNGASLDFAEASVRVRVLLGFFATMGIFSFLTIFSILSHKETVKKVGLIKSSYLPLIIATSEISANQVVFNIFLDRLVDDPNQSVTREWIDAARRYRPDTLRRLVASISQTLRGDIPDEEAAFLREMRHRLKEVGLRYQDNERRFQSLYNFMDTGRVEESRKHVESLKRVERFLNRALSGIGHDIERHMRDIAEEAEDDGQRATLGLALFTAVGILIAGALIVTTNRLLVPLKTLQKAVKKVAMGDFKTRINVPRQAEIGALANGFNKMTEALEERDQMLIRSERLATAGKMAAQVTHEIRNPLSSLGLNAELLEEELSVKSSTDEAQALLRAMQDEIDRLTKITESYLRYSRLPSPEPKLDDLNDTVSAVLDFMKEEIREHGVSLEMNLEHDLEWVFIDRAQIRQALANLVRNACEAMTEGGGALTVRTLALGETVELHVQDTGSGVPRDAADHIFESFFSTKSSGTGLGLPLVRQICVAHGGDARLERTGASGSLFVIALPRVKPIDKE